jgi:hypothetical protein
MAINPREDPTTVGTLSDAATSRAAIGASTNRQLFLMHGGATIALLALLAVLIPDPDFDALTRCAIIALLVYQVGVVCSVFHNIATRRCANDYAAAIQQGKELPDPCRCLGLTVRGGCQCVREIVWRSLAIILFLFGSITVATGAWQVLSQPADDGMDNQVRFTLDLTSAGTSHLHEPEGKRNASATLIQTGVDQAVANARQISPLPDLRRTRKARPAPRAGTRN